MCIESFISHVLTFGIINIDTTAIEHTWVKGVWYGKSFITVKLFSFNFWPSIITEEGVSNRHYFVISAVSADNITLFDNSMNHV